MDASDYCSRAHSGKDAHLPVWLLWLMYQIYALEHKIMSCNELQIAPQLAAKKSSGLATQLILQAVSVIPFYLFVVLAYSTMDS